MAVSFKEYNSSEEQQQLICTIRCRENGSASDCAELLSRLDNCASASLINDHQIVVASVCDCEADRFLIELGKYLSSFTFDTVIEETRFGCLNVSGPVKATLGRFSIVSPDLSEGDVDDDTIFLENGTVFGSGHHPSTRLCVRSLEGITIDGNLPAKILDVGCGSGILSFICSRLGAERVLGIDICPKSIDLANKNRESNCFNEQVVFVCGSLSQVTDEFDLIVANISPSVLHGLIGAFPQRLSKYGRVILAGVHSGQVDGIVKQMLEISCELQMSYVEGSWRALSFQYTGS